jgi:uncharacterized membrane protein
MHTNFDKARLYEEQASRETDPVMKRLAAKRAKQYHNLDLKQEKQQISASKPHYALGRVMTIFGIFMLACFIVVLLAAQYFPDVQLWSVVRATLALVIVIGACALFALGKLSERGLKDILVSVLGSASPKKDLTASRGAAALSRNECDGTVSAIKANDDGLL